MLDIQSLNLKEEVEWIIKNDPGLERAEDLKFLAEYVKRQASLEKFEEIVDEFKKFGFKMPDLDKLNFADWIPSSPVTAFMLIAAKKLNWKEEDVEKMGRRAPLLSPAIKFVIKYFISPQVTFKKAAANWRKHYSFGEVELVSFSQKKKEVIFRLKKFKKHKITCVYLRGSFAGVVGLAVGGANIRAKETKCMFEGDPYHEYIFNW